MVVLGQNWVSKTIKPYLCLNLRIWWTTLSSSIRPHIQVDASSSFHRRELANSCISQICLIRPTRELLLWIHTAELSLWLSRTSQTKLSISTNFKSSPKFPLNSSTTISTTWPEPRSSRSSMSLRSPLIRDTKIKMSDQIWSTTNKLFQRKRLNKKLSNKEFFKSKLLSWELWKVREWMLLITIWFPKVRSWLNNSLFLNQDL